MDNYQENVPQHRIVIDFRVREQTYCYIDIDMAGTKAEAIQHAIEEHRDFGEIEGVLHGGIYGDPTDIGYCKFVRRVLEKRYDAPGDWTLEVCPMSGAWDFAHDHVNLNVLATPFYDESDGIPVDFKAEEKCRHDEIEVDMCGVLEEDVQTLWDALDDILPHLTA